MPEKNKLMVIGFDGADPALIERWTADLPGFRALAASGCRGPLQSTPNMNSASAWSSFATGKNPGKHGILYFDETAVDGYEKRFINASFRAGRTFWGLAGDAGLDVQVINVPISYPVEAVRGLMVAGMDSPGTGSPGFTHPPGLVAELNRVTGGYLVEPGVPGFIKAGNRAGAVKRMRETMDCRLKASLHLMNNHPWSLFVTVFTEIDLAQHFFWRDFSGEEADRGGDQLGDTVKDIYTASDACLQRLLVEAEKFRAAIMVMSDHGGGANTRGSELLNPWLKAAGLLRYADEGGASSPNLLKDAAAKVMASGFNFLDRQLGREAKLALARRFPALRRKVQSGMTFQGIAWERTRAFSDGARDEIWINTKGKLPLGTVAPGGEYDSLVTELIEALKNATDPETGSRLVENAWRKDEIYKGPYIDKAPDILIRWAGGGAFSGMATPNAEVVRMPPAGIATCTGGHAKNGILFASGAGITPGVRVENASIQDIAPTALALLGIEAPEDMDGRALPDITECVAKTAAPGADTRRDSAPEERDYTDEEKKIIEDRLRGMGYIA